MLCALILLSLCACGAKNDFVPARGTATDGVYRNSAFGVTVSVGESFEFFSDEDMASVFGVSVTDVNANPSETDAIYDMYAQNYETGATINAVYEKSAVTGKAYLMLLSGSLENEFSSIGAEIISQEIKKLDINGVEKDCVCLEISLMGVHVYETAILHEVSGWMGVISLATLEESELQELIKAVSFD